MNPAEAIASVTSQHYLDPREGPMAESPAAMPSGCNGEPQHAFSAERGANCPIWVRRCTLCGEIDWQDLINEAAALTVAAGVDEVVIRSQERAACEQELQTWRERAEQAEAANSRVRALHPSREEANAARQVLCVECAVPAPCPTRRAVDDTAGT